VNNQKSLLFIAPLILMVLMACRLGNVTFDSQVVQGSGRMASEERDIRGVTEVSLTGMGDLTIVQGDEEGLTIEADENLLPNITTDVRGSELTIGFRSGISLRNMGQVKFTLRVKDISRVTISGSGNVRSAELNAGELRMTISGSGNVDIANLTASKLQVNTSGSGNFNLAGNVTEQEVIITGSGNYRASDLQSSRASIRVSGSGSVDVWAEDELDVRISGFGSVNYYGQPEISQRITGSGSVRSRGSK
jgi:hypothetical protein